MTRDRRTIISKNRETRAANRWIFALQFSLYGCRPTELNHLRVVNYGGRKAVYCDYQKRGGGGKTEKRELFGLHQKWEKDWNLIEKLEQVMSFLLLVQMMLRRH